MFIVRLSQVPRYPYAENPALMGDFGPFESFEDAKSVIDGYSAIGETSGKWSTWQKDSYIWVMRGKTVTYRYEITKIQPFHALPKPVSALADDLENNEYVKLRRELDELRRQERALQKWLDDRDCVGAHADITYESLAHVRGKIKGVWKRLKNL